MILDSNSQIPVVLPSTDSILTQAQFKFGSTDTPLMFAAGRHIAIIGRHKITV